MAELHSPAQVAALLGIVPGTLRKWSHEFAMLLSPSAAASGPTARRRYSDSDIAQLRQIQALLQHGATYAQARERLAGQNETPMDAGKPHGSEIPHGKAAIGDVTVIEASDQQQALQTFIQAQSDLITRQQQHIADQAQMIDAQRQQVESLTHGLNVAQQQIEDTRADLVGQLEATRARLARVPRWLRSLFGATED